MTSKRAWLENYSWDFVTAQNALLCRAKNAFHGPTSDGHEPTRLLWESKHGEPMTLMEAIELGRKCHSMAPFCFYNGNTFAAIVRDIFLSLNLTPTVATTARSLAGHIVAGVATAEEEQAFREFCERLG